MNELRRWVFEGPWWLVAGVAVVGVVVLLAGLTRGERVMRNGGLAVLALAILWGALSYLVETAEEQAARRTREIVAAYDNADWQRLAALIDPDTRFDARIMGDQIVEAAERTYEALGHRSVSITRKTIDRDAAGIRVRIEVTSEHEHAMARRLRTAWQFDYRQRGDPPLWELDGIDILPTQHLDPEMIRDRIAWPEGAHRSAPARRP